MDPQPNRGPLTDLALKRLKPPAHGRIELSDGKVPGLKFRLTPNGRASWSLQVNIDGRKRRFTIGEYPAIGLAEARRRGQKARVEALDGHDPIKARREAAPRPTVSETIAEYAQLHLRPNLRSADEREQQLLSGLAGQLERPISELSASDLQAAVDRKAREGKLIAANRLRAALMALAAWCWKRGYIGENVGLKVSRAVTERPRERVPTVDDVRQVLKASHDLGPLWGPFLRVLVLTAQRRGDVAGMQWPEINFDKRRWSIPGGRTKNKRPHIVHLSGPVLAELEALRDNATPDRDLVFTTTGRTAISGFSRMKHRLDQLVDLQDWRLHDLRTAFASALCDAGEPEGVVDRVLNHAASGSAPSAVARVYNQSEYLPQRARALDRWTQLLAGEV